VSGARKAWLGGACLALVSVLAVAPTPVAAQGGGHGGPSARQIAHSRHVVGTREHQVRLAAAAMARSRAELGRLNLRAEVAAEAYDGAQVRLAAAQQALHTANLVLTGANRRVAKGRASVTRFATEAYENGGMSTIDAFLSDGGEALLLRRVGALDAISASQRDTVEQLSADQIYQGVVRRNAQQLQRRAALAAAAADNARRAAAADVAHQTALLASMRQRQQTLRGLLRSARSQESRLQRARLRAIARARARAIARREAARSAPVAEPPAPSSPLPVPGGSTAGTVSAGTAAAAVRVAEAQLGKPYVWAAAGPDSFDCSGLVMFAYDQVGVSLDHFTGDQWNEGAHLTRDQLRPGDLVFFAYDTSNPATIHHVGMYIGNGEMVEAPHTGANVEISSYARPDYIGAVRPYQR
jgi:cell wall-associated NlpC family hydrolase